MGDEAAGAAAEIVTERLAVRVGAATMTVHAARPADSLPRPAVLVGFEMFGLTGYAEGIAQRLARAGYLALVPDFYHRHAEDRSPVVLRADAAGRDRGLALVATLAREQVRDDVQAVVDHLQKDPAASGAVAMVGLSAGGHIAFYAATQIPLAAVALFYPGWLTAPGTALSRPDPLLGLAPQIAALNTPVLVLLGEADHLYTADDRAAISAALHDAGVRGDVVVYPDTPHGFFCDERDSYRPGPATDAWHRTLRLLGAELGTGGPGSWQTPPTPEP